MKAKPTGLQLNEALGHDAADKRVDILRRIGAVGSISEAARAAGVSYKAAWQALETLSNLAGATLVERAVGGSGGGGARLTDAGHRLLHAADLLARARASVLAGLGESDTVQGLAALGLRTSMRNQLPCAVDTLDSAASVVRIGLRLSDGTRLGARITGESAQLLGLRPGLPVLALFKATAVRVSTPAAPRAGTNQLDGRVERISRASPQGEIVLRLTSGARLVGFAGSGHGLRSRARAQAWIDESGVVVAVAG